MAGNHRELRHSAILGCTDEVTATFISNRSGDVTVGVSGEAKQLNSWRVSDYTPEYRQTRSIGKRKLLTPDEILRLPLDTALIILRGQKVLQVEKYDYTCTRMPKNSFPGRLRTYSGMEKRSM